MPSGYQEVHSKYRAILFTGDLTWPGKNRPTMLITPPLLDKVSLIPNLEGPLLGDDHARRLRAGATCGIWNGSGVHDLLADEHIEVVGCANNHLTDFRGGAQETQRGLREAGVLIGGVGASIEQARQPVQVHLHDGTRVFLLFIADWRISCTAPRAGRLGVNVMSEPESCALVARLKAGIPNGIVVASVHAGEELQAYPAPYVRKWFRALIAAGADVVLGHHPHVPQGCEKIGESWIFYSLGNFLMGTGRYAGITLKYPPAADTSIGVIVESRGVRAVRLVSDPVDGKVWQDGDAESPGALSSVGFASVVNLDDERYEAAYRGARTVSWWYPLWTGRESTVARWAKTFWLRSVLVARHLAMRVIGRRVRI